MKPELRYNYTGSYRDPKRHHFGCGDWLNEAACREAVAAYLRSPEISGESLRIIVQHKKSRWVHLRNGTAAEIFPDLVVAFEREQAIAEVLRIEKLPTSVRLDAAEAVKRGTVAEALAAAEMLVSTLRSIADVRTVPESALLEKWAERCARAVQERQEAEATATAAAAEAEARRKELLARANAERSSLTQTARENRIYSEPDAL